MNIIKKKKCYEILEGTSYLVKKLHIFKFHAVSEIYHELLKDPNKNLKFIDFDTSISNGGIEHIPTLLNAIGTKKIVTISYKAFHKQQLREHIVSPLLLKEYLNRWYLLGMVDNSVLLVFGLDRINSVSVNTDTFKVDKKSNPQEVFDSIIGVTITKESPQEVILSFTPNQGNYIRSQPIHKYQELIVDNEKEYRVKLYVIPNYELRSLILSYGNEVKVIEPLSLRNEVLELLKSTILQYNDNQL